MRTAAALSLLVILCAHAAVAQTTAPQEAGQAPGEPPLKLYARGDYAGVIAKLGPAFEAGQAGIQDRLLLARAYSHVDKPDAAKTVLDSVLKTDAENPEANSLLGQLLFSRKEFKKAAELLEHSYRLKKSPATASLLGQCYAALGERAKAKDYLETALKEDIRNPTSALRLGEIHLADGSGALAEKYLLLAQEAGLDSAELHRLLGRAYLLQRKYVGPTLVKRFPTSQKVGDIVDDCVVLRKLPDQPDQYLVCTRYCSLYEGIVSERHQQAEVPIEGSGRDRAVLMQAYGWFAAGNNERARLTLRRYHRRTPEAAALRAQLAISAREFDTLEQAWAPAGERHFLTPGAVADFYYQAAMALRGDGDLLRAAAMLKKADAVVPTSAPVLRALAAASVSLGQSVEARQYYARVVELFPDARDIDELRNTLRNLTEKTGGGHATSTPDEE